MGVIVAGQIDRATRYVFKTLNCLERIRASWSADALAKRPKPVLPDNRWYLRAVATDLNSPVSGSSEQEWLGSPVIDFSGYDLLAKQVAHSGRVSLSELRDTLASYSRSEREWFSLAHDLARDFLSLDAAVRGLRQSLRSSRSTFRRAAATTAASAIHLGAPSAHEFGLNRGLLVRKYASEESRRNLASMTLFVDDGFRNTYVRYASELAARVRSMQEPDIHHSAVRALILQEAAVAKHMAQSEPDLPPPSGPRPAFGSSSREPSGGRSPPGPADSIASNMPPGVRARDPNCVKVLLYLNTHQTLKVVSKIAAGVRLSQSTVKKRLQELIDEGWVVRPRARSGVIITPLGKQTCRDLAAASGAEMFLKTLS